MYAGDMGDVASNDGVVSTISVQNANIYGKAHTGAEGTVTIGSQGGVGTHAWQAAGNKGFQDGYVLQDANFTFPDTSLPYSTGLPLGGPADHRDGHLRLHPHPHQLDRLSQPAAVERGDHQHTRLHNQLSDRTPAPSPVPRSEP